MTFPSADKGSAKRFEGRICVLTFFVPETPWPENENPDLFKNLRDAEACPDWIKHNSGCDRSTVFIVANKHGRGYANVHYCGTDGQEGAFLYHSKARQLESGAIIHEFLHLFGAVDLYETDRQSRENSGRIGKMFAKEVCTTHTFRCGNCKAVRLPPG